MYISLFHRPCKYINVHRSSLFWSARQGTTSVRMTAMEQFFERRQHGWPALLELARKDLKVSAGKPECGQ